MLIKQVGAALVLVFLLAVLLSSAANATVPSAPMPADFPTFDANGVDLYTGDMALSIPLMEVPGRGGYSFPLALNYKAGIKTNQPASWVGLGWSLDPGSISRSVNGIPDEYTSDGSPNVIWYNKFTADVDYMSRENRFNFFRSLMNIALSTSFSVTKFTDTRGIGLATISHSTTAASAHLPGIGSLIPVTDVTYETKFEHIPAGSQTLLLDGYLRSFGGTITPSSPTETCTTGADCNLFDYNLPDSFVMQSPLASGEIVYGNKDTSIIAGEGVQMHLKSASGNIMDDGDDMDCGEYQYCRDAVTVNWDMRLSPSSDRFIIRNIDGTVYVFEPIGRTADSNTDPSVPYATFGKNTKSPNADGYCHFNEDFNYMEVTQLKGYTTSWGLVGVFDAASYNDYSAALGGPGDGQGGQSGGQILSVPYSGDAGNWVQMDYGPDFSTTSTPTYKMTTPYNDERYPIPADQFCMENPDGTMSSSETYAQSRVLRRIYTATHYADFIYRWDRLDGMAVNKNDLCDTSNPLTPEQGCSPRLEKIILYRIVSSKDSYLSPTDDVPIMNYQFVHEYKLAAGTPDNKGGIGVSDQTGRLTLKYIRRCAGSDSSSCLPESRPEYYNFEYAYNEPVGGTHNPFWDLHKFDRWGYYYDAGTILSHNSAGHYDHLVSDAWSLTKVTWPTGGTTEWTYENDRYVNVGNWYAPLAYGGDGYDRIGNLDNHYGGGIRVSKIKNCDGMGECLETKYLYNKNGLDFTEADGYPSGNGESSGVAVLEPGSYEFDENQPSDRHIEGTAYSAPMVGYSKVTTVPGYPASDAAPNGYIINEFTTAFDYPNKGYYKPPISFTDWETNTHQYGFSFPRTADKKVLVPKEPFLFFAPYDHDIRFFIAFGRGGSVINPDAVCYKDVHINQHASDCGLYDPPTGEEPGCATVTLDSCTWAYSVDGVSSQLLTGRPFHGGGGHFSCTELEWPDACASFYDLDIHTSSYYEVDPEAMFYIDYSYIPVAGNPINWYCNFETPQERCHYYVYANHPIASGSYSLSTDSPNAFLGCIDKDPENGICDLVEMTPTGGKQFGEIDRSMFRGLNTKTTTYDTNSNPIRTIERTFSMTKQSQIISGTEPYRSWGFVEEDTLPAHYPRAAWITLDQVITTQDGIATTVKYRYDSKAGLVSRQFSQNSDGSRILTVNKYGVGADYDSGMRQYHQWSPLIETNIYQGIDLDEDDLPTPVSTSETVWAQASGVDSYCGPGTAFDPCAVSAGDCFPNNNHDNVWYPFKTCSGVVENSESVLLSSFQDYDTRGNVLETRSYRSPADYTTTRFYYGGGSGEATQCHPNPDQTSEWDHAYVTCVDVCTDGTCSSKLRSRYDYNNGGQITTLTDPNNQPTVYSYDSFFRLTGIRPPGEATDTTTYNYHYYESSANPNWVRTTSRIDDTENAVSYAFADGLGRAKQTQAVSSSAQDAVADMYYKPNMGNVEKASKAYDPSTDLSQSGAVYLAPDQNQPKTFVEYMPEPLQRVFRSHALGPSPYENNPYVEMSYGSEVNPAGLPPGTYKKDCATDEENRETCNYYDKFGNNVKTEEAVGTPQMITTTRTFDVKGNMLTVTNSAGQTTYFEYDTLNRLVHSDNSDSGTVDILYNNDGSIQTKTINQGQPDQIVITYAYDAAGRQVEADLPGDQYDIISYYDGANADTANGKGRLTYLSDASGVTTYKYDTKGRLEQIKKNSCNSCRSVVTTAPARSGCLDGNGDGIVGDSIDIVIFGPLQSISPSSPRPHTDPLFNPNTDLDADRDADSADYYIFNANYGKTCGEGILTTSYTYDDADNIKTITTPSSTPFTVTFSYNDLNQLSEVASSDPPMSVNYDYNPEGTLNNAQFSNGIRTDYTYNQRLWLESINTPIPSQPFQRFYEYDDTGNLLTEREGVLGTSPKLADYTYDMLQRLDTVVDNGYYPGGDMNYDYDSVGNRITFDQSGSRASNYHYSPGANQLVSDRTSKYTFDNRGNMVQKDFVFVPNAGFEIDDNGDGIPGDWIAESATGQFLVESNPIRVHSGAHSGKLVPSGAGSPVMWLQYPQLTEISIDKPTEFTLSGWVYSEGNTAKLWLFWGKEAEPYWGEQDVDWGAYAITNTQTWQWQFLQQTFVVPSYAKYIGIRIDNNAESMENGGKVWFDDLKISSPAYPNSYKYYYTPSNMLEYAVNQDAGTCEKYTYDAGGMRTLKYDIADNVASSYKLYSYDAANNPVYIRTVSDLTTGMSCPGVSDRCTSVIAINGAYLAGDRSLEGASGTCYFLTEDVALNDKITVSQGAMLDCRGHKISGTTAYPTQSTGMEVRDNALVKNCVVSGPAPAVRWGFGFDVYNSARLENTVSEYNLVGYRMWDTSSATNALARNGRVESGPGAGSAMGFALTGNAFVNNSNSSLNNYGFLTYGSSRVAASVAENNDNVGFYGMEQSTLEGIYASGNQWGVYLRDGSTASYIDSESNTVAGVYLAEYGTGTTRLSGGWRSCFNGGSDIQNYGIVTGTYQADNRIGTGDYSGATFVGCLPELQQDASTTLLAHYNTGFDADYAAGSGTATASGVSLVEGLMLNGAEVRSGDSLRYDSYGNFNAAEGTIEFWFKPYWAGNDGFTHRFFHKGLTTPSTSKTYFEKGSNNMLQFETVLYGGVEDSIYFDVSSWQANEWHHLAASWKDSGSGKIYIDGEPVVTSPGGWIAYGDLYFYVGSGGSSHAAEGIIDEFRISNVQRTNEEIMNDYLLGAQALGRAARQGPTPEVVSEMPRVNSPFESTQPAAPSAAQPRAGGIRK